MIRMTLADYAKIHGQAKAASDFGVWDSNEPGDNWRSSKLRTSYSRL